MRRVESKSYRMWRVFRRKTAIKNLYNYKDIGLGTYQEKPFSYPL